jgi:hypothetical protein
MRRFDRLEMVSLGIPFAFWLEAQGCDVTCVSNLDTQPGGLHRARDFSVATTSIT